MDDDTFKNELYERLSTADRAADTLWVINGSLDALKEKLNPRHGFERVFNRCQKAICELAE
jgi:hypothetical protein